MRTGGRIAIGTACPLWRHGCSALFNELHVFENLLALLVGMPRLFMLVQVAPFMGGNILTGQLRMTVVFACYHVLHPAIVAGLPESCRA